MLIEGIHAEKIIIGYLYIVIICTKFVFPENISERQYSIHEIYVYLKGVISLLHVIYQ